MSEKTPKYSWFDVPKAMWYFLGENKKKWVTYNVLLFLVFFNDLIPGYILGQIVDFFTRYKPGDSLNTFYFYTIILGVTAVLFSILRLTLKNRLNIIAIHAKSTARVQGFERLMDFSMQWHTTENSGNKIQRIFNGSAAIQSLTTMLNNSIFPCVAAFIGILLVFLFFSPIFLIFFVAYVCIFIFIQFSFNAKKILLTEELNKLREKSSGTYMENSGNMLVIKALGSEKNIHTRFAVGEEDVKKIEVKLVNNGAYMWYAFQTLNGLSWSIFLLLVAHQFLAGVISVGFILVFSNYFQNLRNATQEIAKVFAGFIQFRSDLLRMMPIFRETSTIISGSEPFPKSWKKVQILDGVFSYDAGAKGIHHMNFSLNKGEALGIAGASGSGKSTLVKILLGLYQLESGKFLIGGKDYYSLDHDDVMKNMAIVLQETELFNLSLIDNITMMRDVAPEVLQQAIDIAQLGPVIQKLPKGLDTLIGEKGYTLSGGERQRIGIARAICKDAPIMILDEATASLDSTTEKLVMDGLMKTLGGKKTFVIIAHRISTLKDTDRVVIFEKGQIVEEGKYAALVKNKKSHLGKLYALQGGK